MKKLSSTQTSGGVNELMPKGELSSASSLAPPSGRTRLKQLVIVGLFVIGLIVCVISLLCIILLPAFVTNQISKKLVLKNNSLLLERWSKPNVPMFFKVWVFDVTNAQEVIDKRGTKPRLKEIGPFVFRLKRQKDIVSFAGENLYYTERKLYHFSPELSCCSINQTVTVPNIPLVAVVDRALSYNLPLVGRFIPRLINRAIQSLREQLFVRKQVRELLFDGYEVELLRMVSRVGSLVGMPQTNQRFALLKGRNDSWRPEQDGVWAINTGQKDRRMFGKVSSWNSYRQLPFWSASSCNQINGSDGTLFPPPIKRSEPLYVFNQELCRSINLIYDRPSDIRDIQAYRFVLNPLNFAHTMTPVAARPAPLFSNPKPSSVAPNQGDKISTNQPLPPPNSQLLTTGAALAPEVADQPNDVSNIRRMSMVTNSQDMKAQASETRRQQVLAERENRRWKNRRNRRQQQVSKPPVSTQPTLVTNNNNNNNNNRASSTVSIPPPPQPTKPAISPPVAILSTSAQSEQQAKLIRAAQEAQALNDRLGKSPKNPYTCFCDRKSTNLNGINVCELDGLIDLSKCTKQAQVIFGSMPHFHQGDPRLLRQVVGLEPNASKHTTYLDIEPNTGLVLGGKRRVQLNLIIKHNNEVEGFENINDMLVPLVWFEESALIPEEAASKFKSLYTDRIRLVNIVLSTLFLAALGLLAIDLKLMAAHYSNCSNLKISCASTIPAGPLTSGLGGSRTKLANNGNNNRVHSTGGQMLATTNGGGNQISRPLLLAVPEVVGKQQENNRLDDDRYYNDTESSSSSSGEGSRVAAAATGARANTTNITGITEQRRRLQSNSTSLDTSHTSTTTLD